MTIDAEDLQLEQFNAWNGDKGDAWTAAQDFIDGMLRPFEVLLVDTVDALQPQNVLDVGCGNGTTTLAIERRLPDLKRCTGIDLSEPMTENARRRSAVEGLKAQFICADAALHPFEAGSFDAVVSRFGVMFFSEPEKAFANLHRATQTSGQMSVIVWRGAQENDFMTAAARAAKPLLPDLSERLPTAPGPFSLSDEKYARDVLASAGWRDVSFESHDVACSFAASDLDLFVEKLAPIGADLTDMDVDAVRRIRSRVRSAYEQYIHGDTVKFVGRCWMIRANA